MYERMMIVVDEGVVSQAAIEEGLALAKSQRSEVLFFHVLPNYVMPISDMPPMVTLGSDEFQRDVRQTGDALLASANEAAKAQGVESSGTMGSGIDAAECIAQAAVDKQCQLVVIGSHGRTAMQRLVFGSVVTRLITLATVPLLVCKQPNEEPEGSEAAEKAE